MIIAFQWVSWPTIAIGYLFRPRGFRLSIYDIFIPMLSAMRRLSFTMQSTDHDHSIPFTSIIGACMLRE
jgi:hypothetical protein